MGSPNLKKNEKQLLIYYCTERGSSDSSKAISSEKSKVQLIIGYKMDDDFSSYFKHQHGTPHVHSKSPKAIPSRVSHFWVRSSDLSNIVKIHSKVLTFDLQIHQQIHSKFTTNSPNKIPHLFNQSKFLFSECEKHVSPCRIQHNRACRTHVLTRYCTTIILCNVRSYTEGLCSQPTWWH